MHSLGTFLRLLGAGAALFLGLWCLVRLQPIGFLHLMYAVVLYPRTPTP
ncbi:MULTISPECIES: hypothetical protein [unclassified Streptomyces]